MIVTYIYYLEYTFIQTQSNQFTWKDGPSVRYWNWFLLKIKKGLGGGVVCTWREGEPAVSQFPLEYGPYFSNIVKTGPWIRKNLFCGKGRRKGRGKQGKKETFN